MTQEEIKQLQVEQQKTWSEFKATLDAQEAEIKKHGAVSGETKAKLDALSTKMDDVEKRYSALEAKLNRPGFVQGDPDAPKGPTAKSAFIKALRGAAITPEEQKLLKFASPEGAEGKALSLGDNTTAAYLAPIEYVNEIIKGVIEFSPLRTIAKVRQTANRSVQVPRRSGTFAAAWVNELATRTETTGLQYALEEIPTHELYALVDVSFSMLEDSAFDLEAELRAEFAEQFGVAEGKAFVSGNSVGKPEGLLTNATVIANYTPSTNASALTADGIIALFYDVKDVFARRGTFVLQRATLKALRQLKDTTNNYLWQPAIGGMGLGAGSPATIMERPYVEAIDMDAVAANKFPIAFGDWTRGYQIVDRLDIAVVRDPYTQAPSGKIRFHARKRVGGQVILPEAIRVQKISVS